MSIFDDYCDISAEFVNGYEYKSINILDDNLESAAEDVAQVIPDHYIAPESVARTLERLGKSAAANKIRTKLPRTKNIRSLEPHIPASSDPVCSLQYPDFARLPLSSSLGLSPKPQHLA